ncbi:MAG: divergent polysaccharide deacetylase family protein [Fusobacteriota bacterium]
MKKIIYVIILSVFIFGFGKGFFEYKKYKKQENVEAERLIKRKEKRALLKDAINKIRDELEENNAEYYENIDSGYLEISAILEKGINLDFENVPLDQHMTENIINFYYDNKKIAKLKLEYFIQNKLAIIIDDVGRTEKTAYKFLEIREPLNFAILPFLPKTKESGDILREAGYLTMLHMPMEAIPRNSVVKGLNKNTKGLINTKMSREEIRKNIFSALESVGPVTGLNNHMGSQFTSDREKMGYALEVAKENNLFYIDSVTQNTTTGYKIAKENGIKTQKRKVFLDNKLDISYIKNQIKIATDLAVKNGNVIAIGHYHSETAQAIKEMLPYITEQEVKLVYVDELLE